MKQCPTCLRDYHDETLNFCFEDGTRLSDDSGVSEFSTVAMRAPLSVDESQTQILDYDERVSLRNRQQFVNSIAVLPLANWSSDPDNQHFCDGLAEDLINALTQIKRLKVAACASSFYFKGKNVKAAEVGRLLGVETILDGSVRRLGNRLRVTVQLVSVAEEIQIWSEQYDRTMGDVFDMQDELTRVIVETVTPLLLHQQE